MVNTVLSLGIKHLWIAKSVAVIVARRKLGLLRFLQLKEGMLISGRWEPCCTVQALCVWPLRTKRG